MKKNIHPSMLASVLILAFNACATQPETPQQMQAEASVPKATAQKIALAKVPGGKVKSAELERERGTLIWSFDIATPKNKNITEVAVDARTGLIASVEIESPEKQAKESVADKHD